MDFQARAGKRHRQSNLRQCVHCAWYVVGAALREIFDESAYARFLLRRERQSSRQAYAEFLRENAVSCQRRPRCC
jgi:hypothetical protein